MSLCLSLSDSLALSPASSLHLVNLGSLPEQGFLEPRVALADFFEPRRVRQETDLQEASGLSYLETSSQESAIFIHLFFLPNLSLETLPGAMHRVECKNK